MVISTITQKTVTGVRISLTADEARELRTIIGSAKGADITYRLYEELGRAFRDDK